MMSKHEEAGELEMREFDQAETDVIVDDFKDLKIEMVASSHNNLLRWDTLDS